MKTLVVVTSTFPRWPGDAEPPFVYELSRRLAAWYKVIVLAPHSKGTKTTEHYSGIEVRRFRYFFTPSETLCYEGGIIARLKQNPLRYFLIPFFFCAQSIALFRLIKTVDPDVIHSHWIIPQTLSCVLVRFLLKKKPALICTSHGGDLYSLKGYLLNRLKKWVLQKADFITVVNSTMKSIIADLVVDIHHIDVIPMGVDTKQTFVAKNTTRKPFSLLFIGRLVEKKGLTYLLDAMPQIINRFPETTLTVIGMGPLEEALKQHTADLRISGHVNFLGSIQNEQLPFFYQTHQLSIFPFIVSKSGDREGLPVVISEAMGCGCTIVTTDLPGINDLVEHNQNGVIVPQKNSQALAETVIDLFSHPSKAQDLAKDALWHVQNHLDWEIIARQYNDVFQQCFK